MIHILAPAAGPIFSEWVGYGARFTRMPLAGELIEVSDYL